MSKKGLLFGLLIGLSVVLSAQSAILRDPTQPSFLGEQNSQLSSGGLGIKLISVGSKHKHVVINDRTLVEGDTINGYRVVNIDENTVRLQGPQGVLRLHLLHEMIKPSSMSERNQEGKSN